MAQKLERTRTPDQLAGAEGLSRELANVLNFAFQRQQQQAQQQQALAQVKAMQQAEDDRLEQKIRADFSNLQTKLADEGLRWKEEKELRERELKRRGKEDELSLKLEHLENLRQLEGKSNELKLERIKKDIEGSKENRDLNLIQASRALYPAEEYIGAFEAIIKNPMNFPNSPAYIDPNPYLERAEFLRRQRKAFLQSHGLSIPEEAGPFNEESGGLQLGVPPLNQQQPQQQFSPFDFMGAGGRELTTPPAETPKTETKSKPKLDY